MSEVRIRENESLESALKRFKRQCARSGVLQEVRKREHYEKPSVKRKKKAEAAKTAAAQEAPAAETVKAEPVKAETVKAEPVKDMNAEILQEMDRQLNGPAVPTIQVPLRSESTDGNVEVTEEGNGYHTATIG